MVTFLLLLACGINSDFESPGPECLDTLSANITYSELKAIAANGTIQIQEEHVIEGFVISSDQEGNFFNTIHFQESFSEEAEGFQMEMELRDSHLFFPLGTKIYIKLKNLFVGRSKGVYKIGSAFTSFGSVSVGRLPTLAIKDHLVPSCGAMDEPIPKNLPPDALSDKHVNTLVVFDEMQISEEELGLTYAIPKEETARKLLDCYGNDLILLNSGFADFQAEPLPEGNGTVRGVLHKEGNDFVLRIRMEQDILFDSTRCVESDNYVSSDSILISEIADPDNENGARFVELYNSGKDAISLEGWELRRYTNDQTEASSKVDMSGQVIEGEETLVISPNAEVFQALYDFLPDVDAGTNSPADSNGDDNLELVDPFETVIDRFGLPGEDGTGTNHEFEDGGAFRKPGILTGSPDYIFDQWMIYNDTGGEGTILQPLTAPEDFSPGVR